MGAFTAVRLTRCESLPQKHARCEKIHPMRINMPRRALTRSPRRCSVLAAMNNVATVCITLFGMFAVDVLLIGQHGLDGSSGYDLQPVYMAEMPPVKRNDRIAARRFVIYDTSVAPARVFPTRTGLLSADKWGYQPAPGETANRAH